MSVYCGIELKGNEAILVLVDGKSTDFKVVSSPVLKIKIIDSNLQEDINAFRKAFFAFVDSHNVDFVGIKARATKGRFSGGAVSFKMEGIIQLLSLPVSVIHGKTISAKLKDHQIDYSSLKKYQLEAMNVAYYLMLKE